MADFTSHGPFPVTVDRKSPLVELAKQVGFDRSDQDERAILMAIGRENIGSTLAVRLYFLHCGAKIRTEDVLAEISNRYLVPASLTELFSLAALAPEKMCTFRSRFPIITLGTEWKRAQAKPSVGFVTGGLHWLQLFFVDPTMPWLESSHFLASERF